MYGTYWNFLSFQCRLNVKLGHTLSSQELHHIQSSSASHFLSFHRLLLRGQIWPTFSLIQISFIHISFIHTYFIYISFIHISFIHISFIHIFLYTCFPLYTFSFKDISLHFHTQASILRTPHILLGTVSHHQNMCVIKNILCPHFPTYYRIAKDLHLNFFLKILSCHNKNSVQPSLGSKSSPQLICSPRRALLVKTIGNDRERNFVAHSFNSGLALTILEFTDWYVFKTYPWYFSQKTKYQYCY